MNQIVTNLDLSLKRERFRVSIRKQRLSELFNENRRKTINLPQEINQREIDFVDKIIEQIGMLSEDNIEGIMDCLSFGIKAFEESKNSSHIFSLLWIKKLDQLISLSQSNAEVKVLSQSLIAIALFNNKDIAQHEAFDKENIKQFLRGNIFSEDTRLIADAILILIYLSEEKQIYRDMFTENNFEIIQHTIKIDEHLQLVEMILGSMQQALENSMVISKEAAYKIFHPYLCEKYFYQEIHWRTMTLRNIQELIEKIEDSEQKQYVQYFMKTNTFQQILSQSKQNNSTQLQAMKVCIICYGIEDILDLEILDFFYNILSKFQRRDCNIQTQLRIMIYWALSNKTIMEDCISDLIHHKIFEFLALNAYTETLSAQIEISYIYFNISHTGNAQHCSYMIQFNFIENVRIFLLSTQPNIEKLITQTLINILYKLREASDPNNELLVSFNNFKQALEAKQIVEIISSSNQIDFDLKNSFDVFF